jgi:hypothetical protein
MKVKLIRMLVVWMNKKYPYLLRDVVVGEGRHIHRDPPKGRKKVKNGQ